MSRTEWKSARIDIDPAIAPTAPPDAVPLGSHAGQELYLNPGELSQKEFSDFVLFVLEATLQSTSSSGGVGAGKGTPQKGGPLLCFSNPLPLRFSWNDNLSGLTT